MSKFRVYMWDEQMPTKCKAREETLPNKEPLCKAYQAVGTGVSALRLASHSISPLTWKRHDLHSADKAPEAQKG